MDKQKIKNLKLEISKAAQEICDEMDGVIVDISIETCIQSKFSGNKSTLITDVRVSFSEEI